MSSAQLPDEPPRRPWWLVPAPLVQNVVTVVVVLALVVELITVPEVSWRGVTPVVLAGLGFAALRRRPVVGFVAAVLAPLSATFVGTDPLPAWNVGVFVALLLTLRGFPAVLTGVGIGAANFGSQAWADHSFSLAGAPAAYAAGFAAVAAAAAGSAVQVQHRYASALELRAQEALARRNALVQRGIAEERLRIARDLHDSVGHAVAVVNMRIGAAEVRLPPESDDVRADLHAARAGVQDVLREMQQILRVLRVEGGDVSEVPDLRGVPELLENLRRSGLDVQADLSGLDRTPELPPQVATAVYRIVQESLTNVHKHGTGPVRVVVARQDHRVLLEVGNPLRAGATRSAAGGRGLVGMRERATAAGGRLEVVREDDRFIVRAHLPATSGGTL